MKNVSVKVDGMTVDEAIKAIEAAVREQTDDRGHEVPDVVKEALRNAAIPKVGDRFVELTVEFKLATTQEVMEEGIKNIIGTDGKNIVTVSPPEGLNGPDDWSPYKDKADFLEQVAKKYGPIPEYNGLIGDSCPCESCRYRRKIDGPNVTEDLEKGLSFEESVKAVRAGYEAEHRSVPNDAVNVEDVAARIGRVKVHSQEKAEELYPQARKGMVMLFGEDHPNVKTLDHLMEINRKGTSTIQDRETLQALTNSVNAKLFH